MNAYIHTYMHTYRTFVSVSSCSSAKALIREMYGKEYTTHKHVSI